VKPATKSTVIACAQGALLVSGSRATSLAPAGPLGGSLRAGWDASSGAQWASGSEQAASTVIALWLEPQIEGEMGDE
jgi:hypothetical protein